MKARTILIGLVIMATGSLQATERDSVSWMASRLLSGKDVLNYELAVRKFVSFSDPRVLPTLLKMVDFTEKTPRAAAAGVLWQYNTKEVREKLVELTRDLDPEVQVEAAKSLCLMNYTASLTVIEEVLKDDDADVRARAIRALAPIKDKKALAVLESLRSIEAPRDQVWIAYALHRHGVRPAEQLGRLEKTLFSLPAAAWLPGKPDPTEEDLRRAERLANKNTPLRLEAARALDRIGDDKALRLLARATGDLGLADLPDGPRHLLRRHGSKASAALVQELTSDKVLVRLGCVLTAAEVRLGDDAARRSLASALGSRLTDGSRRVRLAALASMAAAGFDSQTPAVVKTLKHDDPQTRRAAARALGALGRSETTGPLIKRLKSEQNRWVRRSIYRAISVMQSPQAVEPMFKHLLLLHKESRQNVRVADEIPLCIDALAAGGSVAAEKALRLLPRSKGARRELLVEILARSGSERALAFFMDQLREVPPDPVGPNVRFFDSLDASFVPRLKQSIESETAMWIRVILARTLFRLGQTDYGRGIIWGLRNEDAYMRKLAAALSAGIDLPGSTEPLVQLLSDEPDTARLASRALLAANTPGAVDGFLRGLSGDTLRARTNLPVTPFWEGQRSAQHPFAKEVDNDRVWVVFAEDRLGRRMDLFITWSADGKIWKEPAFTGLTSFADPEGHVPPPTFSLKARGRSITIALTRTFAQSAKFTNPRFKTLQRIHKYKLKDFFQDQDNDGLPDLQEQALWCKPGRADSDGDGLPDGRDKNPLAKPADPDLDEEVLPVLAFSYAYLVRRILPEESRLLVVELMPRRRRPPELPTYPHLVLHLNAEQIRTLWKATGAGFPRVRFEPAEILEDGERAVQTIKVMKGIDDEESIEVSFVKRDGKWIVDEYVD